MQDILCTVNTQHNCAHHKCEPSGFRFVYQERERTDGTRPVIAHSQPGDLVLNLTQMRDTIHLQRFRVASEELDVDQIITASAAREIAMRKLTGKDATGSGTTIVRASKTTRKKAAGAAQPHRLSQLQTSQRPRT